MAINAATNVLEKVIGHDAKGDITMDVSNPGQEGGKYADPSGEKMKALTWYGKNDVRVGA
jgi:hypothetical protein